MKMAWRYISVLGFLLIAACGANQGSKLDHLTATIYYMPIIDKSKQTCAKSEEQNMLDANGKVLTTMCKKDLDNCGLQGSCYVVDGGKTRSFHFKTKKEGVIRFVETDPDACPYGMGVQSMCLDPYFSVASDPAYHKPGSVIFVPKIAGIKLPDGRRHNGYLIVRDEGGSIKGPHRFDFFTGFVHPYDSNNVFAKLGLGDPDSKIEYQTVTEDIAAKVREFRNYPSLPEEVKREDNVLSSLTPVEFSF